MKAPRNRAELLWLLVYTLGGGLVFTLYVLIPFLITLGAMVPDKRLVVAIALALLIGSELVIFAVLARTTRRQRQDGAPRERRSAARQPVAFDVDIDAAHDGTRLMVFPIRAHAINASTNGLAVLVDPRHWQGGFRTLWVRTHLSSQTMAAKAQLVGASDVVVDGQPQRLLRLRLIDGGQRYAGYVDEIQRLSRSATAERATDGRVTRVLEPIPAPGRLTDGRVTRAFEPIPAPGRLTDGRVTRAFEPIPMPGRPTDGRVTRAFEPIPAVAGLAGRITRALEPVRVQPATARSAVRPRELLAHLPLLVILTLQALASLLLRNTAYQDEALYLYAGRQFFNHLIGRGGPLEYGVSSFSGFPYIYPLIAGAIDAWGGLGAARFFSLSIMLATTLMVYAIGRRLFDRSSALLAAAVFAAQGSVLFLGQLATYDAMCLALIGAATVLALRASASRAPWLALAIGPLLMLAVMTKYVGVLFAPSVLAILAWQTSQNYGWRQGLLRTLLALLLIGVAGALLLASFGAELVPILWQATVNRIILSPDSRLHLAFQVWLLGGAILTLGAVGVVSIATRDRRRRLLGLLLLGTALLPAAYHIYMSEIISLHKHLAYGFMFAAPLAGYALAQFGDRRKMIGVVASVIVFSMGISASQELYRQWPNTSALVQNLQSQRIPAGARVLAEAAYEPRYYLQNQVDWNWTTLWYFRYTDASGEHLSGVDAYRAALQDGYFDLVELGYGPNRDTAQTARAIDDSVRNNPRYELVGKVPYQSDFGSGEYWIWRRRDDGAAGGTPAGAPTTQTPDPAQASP